MKVKPILAIFPIGLIAFILVFVIGLQLDHYNDVGVCSSEFTLISGMVPDSSFANDDHYRYNLGENITCSVFWNGWDEEEDKERLARVDFMSGKLTHEMIISARYW